MMKLSTRFLFLFLMGALTFMACSTTEDDCPAGYEGDDCQEIRAKYFGTYDLLNIDCSSSGTSLAFDQVVISSGGDQDIYALNLSLLITGEAHSIDGVLDGDKITAEGKVFGIDTQFEAQILSDRTMDANITAGGFITCSSDMVKK